MHLQTTVKVPDSPMPIELADSFLCVGSCFAETLASRLAQCRFPVCLNPAGIIYNPLSICRLLNRLGRGEYYSLRDLLEFDGLWLSLDHHGNFSDPDANVALNRINDAFEAGVGAVKSARWLIVTLGTAYVYEYTITGAPVVNCHRLPPSQFERRLLRSPQIVEELERAVTGLHAINPDIRIMLTVSPVRHLRDSAPLNSLSKAQLITACHDACAALPACCYFPAYEIVLDELRDYRFFERDLVHPSELAQDIVWEKFTAAFFSGRAREFLAAYDPIRQAARHRIRHAETPAAIAFREKQAEKLARLAEAFPERVSV